MRLLTDVEKSIFEDLMKGIPIEKLKCWDHIIPEGFISESERDGFKK